MTLHFSMTEYKARIARCLKSMEAKRLDGMLLFKQESMYYLTGYDRIGYLSFQVLYLDSNGAVSLLTRTPDAVLARQTSTISDIEIWKDREGVNPAVAIREFLERRGASGKQLGVEYRAIGLSTQRGKMLDEALDGFCVLRDESDLVDQLRWLKSAAELEYVRQSAVLCHAALDEANRLSTPGTFEGDIYAAMNAAILRGDGDPPGSGVWPMGSGKTALLLRYHSGRRYIGANDQITHEFGASYRHYHTCLMHCVVTGSIDPRQRDMFAACKDALEACKDNCRPGRTFGEIFDAHANAFAKAGYAGIFPSAIGYHLGATFPPSWAEEPFIYAGSPLQIEPNMVIFLHMILHDEANNLAMSVGETVLCTATGQEQLTNAPKALVVN
ncbi:aminopeptidase P family protein [Bradyrhizobium canariense]|uniref:M24 family metallopeptidase n=1 Tax=Bradyrhizobium canariense TaxID=255045 RepID=UPI001C671A7E|nr:Xaa-Pro peptidase family protein [Bradyrhizobium canariense]MBW5434061.1 aminopeptidase P family protein [Bradyrhizobium canariense]